MNSTLRKISETIIQRLIDAQEGNLLAPFECPWDGDPMPINCTTDIHYQGMNIFVLWGAAMDKGYTTNKWCTPKQLTKYARDNELTLDWKGEKCTTGIRWLPYEHKTRKSEEPSKTLIPRPFWVLNMDQVKGFPKDPPPTDHGRIDNLPAQKFIDAVGAEIKHGESRAYFSPSKDIIMLPEPNSFPELGDYHATAFHELGHWTGHAQRLDRNQKGKMGDPDYAFEEIIAEMTSAFFAAKFNLKGRLQHTEYVGSYIKCLQQDLNLVRKASTSAGNAYDYLTSLTKGATTK